MINKQSIVSLNLCHRKPICYAQLDCEYVGKILQLNSCMHQQAGAPLQASQEGCSAAVGAPDGNASMDITWQENPLGSVAICAMVVRIQA